MAILTRTDTDALARSAVGMIRDTKTVVRTVRVGLRRGPAILALEHLGDVQLRNRQVDLLVGEIGQVADARRQAVLRELPRD